MRRNVLAPILLIAVLALSGTALFIVGFGLKEREPGREVVLPGQVIAPSPPSLSSVDGHIGGDEYPFSFTDPQTSQEGGTGISLYWRIERGDRPEGRDLIYVGLHSPLPGRIEIVLAPAGPMMTRGDVIVGYVRDDGTVVIRDDYGDGPTSNISDEEQPGGQDDIIGAAGSGGTDADGTTIEFVRALETTDRVYDRGITPGKMRVMLGNSRFNNLVGLGGDTWITLDVDFFGGTATPVLAP